MAPGVACGMAGGCGIWGNTGATVCSLLVVACPLAGAGLMAAGVPGFIVLDPGLAGVMGMAGGVGAPSSPEQASAQARKPSVTESKKIFFIITTGSLISRARA